MASQMVFCLSPGCQDNKGRMVEDVGRLFEGHRTRTFPILAEEVHGPDVWCKRQIRYNLYRWIYVGVFLQLQAMYRYNINQQMYAIYKNDISIKCLSSKFKQLLKKGVSLSFKSSTYIQMR